VKREESMDQRGGRQRGGEGERERQRRGEKKEKTEGGKDFF